MKLRTMMSTMMASSLLLAGLTTGPALADDGAITNKDMSRTINLPDFGQDIVNNAVPEDEHAFTDMMGFYVPAQAASGLVGPIEYLNIDEVVVEELEVAKPLVNVFIHGPAFGVEGTAFAHRWFDTYAAVSLDDGETWKQTNLSESADLSSFNLDTDPTSGGGGGSDPLPNDHTELLGDDEGSGDGDSEDEAAFHAPGYDTPFTSQCTECHGVGLQGTGTAPSCYSCHDDEWDEETPVEVGPVITQAEWDAQNKNKGVLDIEGVNAGTSSGDEGSDDDSGDGNSVEVSIINAITGEVVGTTEAEDDGEFEFEEEFKNQSVPCVVAAEYTDQLGEEIVGPAVPVVDDETGEPIENCTGAPVDLTEYPGGTYNVFHATAGNKTLVAWPSRFCSQGQPAYQMSTETQPDLERLAAVTAFIQNGDLDLGVPALPGFTSPEDGDLNDDLYLTDAFGVAGNQGSIDFADEGYPQAGVVPFGCVWASRGVLLPGDDPRTDEVEESYMVWTKAERLTSGRRDVNRIEVKAVKGAGFVMTWQEDPEGLRPGQGLGPGEGWSGAVAHSQTDVWYSFINEEYFDLVEVTDDSGAVSTTPIDILDHDLLDTGRPQVYVPMAVPMRMTNNARCNPPADENTPTTDDLYCDFELAGIFGIKDQCADTVTLLTGNPNSPGGQTETDFCVADIDGDEVADLVNRANTASTRPRLGAQAYDVTVDDKSAWVVFAAEESKGLGTAFFEPDSDGDGSAEPCTEGDELPCTEEIGKNQWYHSFDMGTPDTSAGIGDADSLVSNLVYQGDMLNQGEVYWETGELFGLMNTVDITDFGDYNYDILNTEIARRASLLIQSIGKATAASADANGAPDGTGLLAIPSWKQGPMRQGGPADTMLRRIVLPEGYDPATDGNPYAVRNMVCEEYLIGPYVDGDDTTSPYYPNGVCADPAINLSGVVPDLCLDDDTGGIVACPTIDCEAGSTYCIGDTNPILQGIVQGEGNTQRVLAWHQCPSVYTPVDSDGVDPVACDATTGETNLADQSWYNPLDISKGHRGFIDGNFVQFLYAWSPNWRLNAKGSDRYDLYVRRSFDGGETWTVTPSSFAASDGLTYSGEGTVTCENYRSDQTQVPQAVEPKACYEFLAGAAEHARNITMHKSMRITTLDPRYAPTKATIEEGCTDGLFDVLEGEIDPADGIFTCDDGNDATSLLDSDVRDPSRYFMVYETGDNTTVEVGEAEPLDLFYARAEGFGDNYVVWTETDTETPDDLTAVCYPSNAYGVLGVEGTILEGSGFCNEFDNMNTGSGTHASEANMEANPDGSKLYSVWAQWVFDATGEEVEDSNAMARRIWWIDDYVSDTEAYTLPGTSQP